MKNIENNLDDMKLVFSSGRNVDVANEYWAYKKADRNCGEFEVLKGEIEARAGKGKVESWVRNHKMSNTDERDLNFYKSLFRKGYRKEEDIMNEKLSVLRGYANNIYGVDALWEGSIKFKDKDGNVSKKGYGNSLDKVNPEIIFRFCKNKFKDGMKVYERTSGR